MRSPYQDYLAIFSLFLLTIFNYANSLSNNYIIDDFNFLKDTYQNTFVSIGDYFSKTKSQHYIPFYYLLNINLFSHFSQFPVVLHLVNIFLFFSCAVLLFILVKQITDQNDTAFITSLIFILHPINSDLADYLTSGNFFLSTIFLLFSLLLLFKEHRLASLTFYFLSLLCFEGALSALVVIFLFLFLIKKYPPRRIYTILLPFLICSLFYLILWKIIAAPNIALPSKVASLHLSLSSYMGTLFYLITWYISNLFFPFHITLIQNTPPLTEGKWLWVALFFVIIGILIFTAKSFFKKDVKTFALLLFLNGFVLSSVTVFAHPYMGLVIEPRWFFFSSMGFFLLLALLLKKAKTHLPPAVWFSILIGISLYLYFNTQPYHIRFRNEKTYAQYWLNRSPGNLVAMTTLAKIYTHENNYPVALDYYSRILKSTHAFDALAYHNMGLIYDRLNNLSKAKEMLIKSIQADPSYVMAYNSLATIFVKQKDFNQAKNYFLQAIHLDQQSTLPFLNLADLYILDNEDPKAIVLLEKLLDKRLNDNDLRDVYCKLTVLYYKNGEFDKSSRTMGTLIIRNPSPDNFLALSQAFASMDVDTMAKEVLNKTLKIYPNYTGCYLAYGEILYKEGHRMEAISYWEKGSSLDPHDERFKSRIESVKEEL